MHLLLCEDTIWSNWVFIMDTYARGGLPNTKGVTLAPTIAEQKSTVPKFKRGKIQQAAGTVPLGPTLFRCIAGLESTEVLALQAAIIDKTIILKKSKQVKDMVDMEEFAWSLKVDRILQAAILDFYNDLTKEIHTWDQLCEKYKLGSYEYNQLKSYTEIFVKDCLNRTKKRPSLPSTAVTLLHHLYRASMDTGTSENSIPWTIKGVGLDTQKLEAFCQQFNVPFQLAIMDARGFCKDLSVDTFSSITKGLNAMNSRLEYIFICFIDFIKIGCLVEGVRSQSGKVLYEVGTITKDNEQSLTTGVAAYASVVLFVSKGNNFESIDKAPGEKVFMSASVSARGDTIDIDFLVHLIEGFSPEQNYVLDLFSGGIVLQQSLMSKRRCIALCKDDLEAMTLEAKCSQILHDNPQIQEWCGAQESSQNRVIELDNTELNALNDLDFDEQISADDEDEENSKIQESSSSDEEEEVNTVQSEQVNKDEKEEVNTVQLEELHKDEEEEANPVQPEQVNTIQPEKVNIVQPEQVNTVQPEEVHKERSGVGKHIEDNENQQGSGADEEAVMSNKNKDKDKEKEEASFVHQSNEDKEGGGGELNKNSDDVEESSQIGRLKV